MHFARWTSDFEGQTFDVVCWRDVAECHQKYAVGHSTHDYKWVVIQREPFAVRYRWVPTTCR